MFEIVLDKITCITKDSFGLDSDEPYVITYTVDLAGMGLLAQGATKTTLYGPWVEDESMDGGDSRKVDDPTNLCWGINEEAQDIASPDDVVILVGLLESDADKDASNQVRTTVHSLMFASLSTISVANTSRAELVEQLRDDFQGHLETQRKLVSLPEFDELLGDVQVLSLTQAHLDDARVAPVKLPKVRFTNDDDDFEYELRFVLRTGDGTGSAGQAIESDLQAVDANLDPHRPAIAMDAAGSRLDLVSMPNGLPVAQRVSSDDGGGSWTFDASAPQIGEGRFSSGLATAVSADGKHLHVFGRGNDNRIWRAYSPDGGTHFTLAWAPIGDGVFTSAPAATLSADGKHLHVFGRGNDNRIWRAYSPDGGTHFTLAWAPIGDGVFSSGPAAAVSGDGARLHVFGRGVNPPPPPPGTFPDPEEPRVWRAFSADGGAGWQVAWVPIKPAVVNAPVPQ